MVSALKGLFGVAGYCFLLSLSILEGQEEDYFGFAQELRGGR